MAITYTWAIKALYTVQQPNPDYVVNAIWTLTGVDGSTPPVTASIDGNTQFAVDADKPNYVPYADLTEADVIEWVKNSLGEQGIANFEANVNGQIESILNPPVSPENTPFPWASTAAEAA